MTVDLDDKPDDGVLGSLARLQTYDVSPRCSRQLRRRCHALLRAEPPSTRWAWMTDEAPLRRLIVPTLGGAWCLAYLVEIIRCTAAIYNYFGTQ
jgi:hypothetical protein